MGRLDLLAAWHLPDGPAGLPSRWSATSSVEVGQTAYTPLTAIEETEWSEGQSHKEEEREGRSGTGKRVRGPLAEDGWRYLDICAGAL